MAQQVKPLTTKRDKQIQSRELVVQEENGLFRIYTHTHTHKYINII